LVFRTRENELIGYFSVYRQEVRPFIDKQIDLLTNFASQVVIVLSRSMNEGSSAINERQSAESCFYAPVLTPCDELAINFPKCVVW
jgi:GAF domain-containing protein